MIDSSKSVIGCVGVIGSGKNFRALELEARGYTTISFADPLREMLWDILGWTPKNNEEYEKFKEMEYSYLNTVRGRHLLQNIGNRMRKIDKDFWCKQWAQKVDSIVSRGGYVCCPDVRYLNEASFVVDTFGGDLLFCDYKSERYDSEDPDVSEQFAQYFIKQGKWNDGEIIKYGDWCNIRREYEDYLLAV